MQMNKDKNEKKVLKVVAKMGKFAANTAIDTTSWFGFYQAKEPESLRKKKQDKTLGE